MFGRVVPIPKGLKPEQRIIWGRSLKQETALVRIVLL